MATTTPTTPPSFVVGVSLALLLLLLACQCVSSVSAASSYDAAFEAGKAAVEAKAMAARGKSGPDMSWMVREHERYRTLEDQQRLISAAQAGQRIERINDYEQLLASDVDDDALSLADVEYAQDSGFAAGVAAEKKKFDEYKAKQSENLGWVAREGALLAEAQAKSAKLAKLTGAPETNEQLEDDDARAAERAAESGDAVHRYGMIQQVVPNDSGTASTPLAGAAGEVPANDGTAEWVPGLGWLHKPAQGGQVKKFVPGIGVKYVTEASPIDHSPVDMRVGPSTVPNIIARDGVPFKAVPVENNDRGRGVIGTPLRPENGAAVVAYEQSVDDFDDDDDDDDDDFQFDESDEHTFVKRRMSALARKGFKAGVADEKAKVGGVDLHWMTKEDRITTAIDEHQRLLELLEAGAAPALARPDQYDESDESDGDADADEFIDFAESDVDGALSNGDFDFEQQRVAKRQLSGPEMQGFVAGIEDERKKTNAWKDAENKDIHWVEREGQMLKQQEADGKRIIEERNEGMPLTKQERALAKKEASMLQHADDALGTGVQLGPMHFVPGHGWQHRVLEPWEPHKKFVPGVGYEWVVSAPAPARIVPVARRVAAPQFGAAVAAASATAHAYRFEQLDDDDEGDDSFVAPLDGSFDV